MSCNQQWIIKVLFIYTALFMTGCAHQSASFTSATAETEAERQMAAINWDEITAPTSVVQRDNAFLIMMR